MRFLKAILLAITAIVLAWQPANADPAPGNDSSALEAAPIVIGFSPPLGEPLYYRSRRVAKAPSGDETGEGIFTVSFQREGSGFRMIVTQISFNGRAVRDRPLPPILIEQTFRLEADGKPIGMEDETAYWTAIETIIRGEKDASKRQGMLRTMRDAQTLPLRDRLNWISDEFRSIIAFASRTFPNAPEEYPEVRNTVVGPIEGRFQFSLEQVTKETIVFNQTWQISPEQLERTLVELTARFGSESADYGDLVRAQETRTRVEVDRATGLLRGYNQIQETRTERGGVSLYVTTTVTVERIARDNTDPKLLR